MVRKRNKYGAVRTTVEGITFHSKKEAARYLVLRDELAHGHITDLRLQVRYKLCVCVYIADFVYIRDGIEIVEDVKGRLTGIYKLKKKMMAYHLGIFIYET